MFFFFVATTVSAAVPISRLGVLTVNVIMLSGRYFVVFVIDVFGICIVDVVFVFMDYYEERMR